ncbi:MAG: Omp28-related outer membrane protein [Alistipes sp.]|nr:Omp28-related outer membrane protein [Alistipes sp.]
MKTWKLLAMFCLSALAFVGCVPGEEDDNKGNGGNKSLILVADKTTIYDNGIDGATFTLYYDGLMLEQGFDLYIGEGAEMVAGNKFVSTTQGTFEIWAAYGAAISNTVNINVIATPPPAPAAPEDTNPSKTNFVRRNLLTQFTGTGCGYCPLMMNALHQVLTDANYGNKVVVAAAHLYNESDPCWLTEAQTLDNAMSVTGYPSLYADLNKSAYGDATFASLKSCIDKAQSRVSVKGGIAVSSKYYAEENYIVLNATVKAKETTEFRVGAWLLEDNIYGKQSVYPNPYSDTGELIQPLDGVDFNNHNNAIRLADSKASNTDFSGYSLGTIEAGKTASREFAFKLKDNGTGSKTKWNHDNLRVIVFISTKEGSKWYVNNVVKCPKDGSVDFEYEN